MKFFLDSADLTEIETLNRTGMVDGVTTNPSLIAKSGRSIKDVIKGIADMVAGPVSAEVTATDLDGMMREADILRALGDNVAIKVPLTMEGLNACRRLRADGTEVNVTLCFSANQAILAAKAGASYVSPFIGRYDDNGMDGMQLIADIVHVYNNYGDFFTEVLAASIRSPYHVLEAAKMGAHICTIPGKILQQLYQHPLTDLGLAAFLKDWEATGQKIVA